MHVLHEHITVDFNITIPKSNLPNTIICSICMWVWTYVCLYERIYVCKHV